MTTRKNQDIRIGDAFWITSNCFYENGAPSVQPCPWLLSDSYDLRSKKNIKIKRTTIRGSAKLILSEKDGTLADDESIDCPRASMRSKVADVNVEP